MSVANGKKTNVSKGKKVIHKHHVPPLPETMWAIKNLMLAFYGRQMNDPDYTQRQWASDAKLGNASIISRMQEQGNLGLDKAVRLSRPLGVSLNDLLREPTDFIKNVLHLDPKKMIDHFGRKTLQNFLR